VSLVQKPLLAVGVVAGAVIVVHLSHRSITT